MNYELWIFLVVVGLTRIYLLMDRARLVRPTKNLICPKCLSGWFLSESKPSNSWRPQGLHRKGQQLALHWCFTPLPIQPSIILFPKAQSKRLKPHPRPSSPPLSPFPRRRREMAYTKDQLLARLQVSFSHNQVLLVWFVAALKKIGYRTWYSMYCVTDFHLRLVPARFQMSITEISNSCLFASAFSIGSKFTWVCLNSYNYCLLISELVD
jgi:hypothetical protein